MNWLWRWVGVLWQRPPAVIQSSWSLLLHFLFRWWRNASNWSILHGCDCLIVSRCQWPPWPSSVKWQKRPSFRELFSGALAIFLFIFFHLFSWWAEDAIKTTPGDSSRLGWAWLGLAGLGFGGQMLQPKWHKSKVTRVRRSSSCTCNNSHQLLLLLLLDSSPVAFGQSTNR